MDVPDRARVRPARPRSFVALRVASAGSFASSPERHSVGKARPSQARNERVRAAFFAAAWCGARPLVAAAFFAAAERAPGVFARAATRACRARATGVAARAGSRFSAARVARLRLASGERLGSALPRAESRAALFRVRSDVDPAFGAGRSTPARRAFDNPMAIACLVERAPCLPSRTCSISSRTNSPACVLGALPSALSCCARLLVRSSGIEISAMIWLVQRGGSDVGSARRGERHGTARVQTAFQAPRRVPRCQPIRDQRAPVRAWQNCEGDIRNGFVTRTVFKHIPNTRVRRCCSSPREIPRRGSRSGVGMFKT